jgi:hypothetical protein
MFRLSQDANINGTHRQSEVYVSPAKLVEKFGEPIESDGYKVSGEYVFESDDGMQVFTLYDWKATTLYDPDYGVAPSDFWARTIPVQFNIGGHTNAFDFIDWLKREVQ